MFCMKCGKPIDEESLFCPHCGTQIPGTQGEQEEGLPVSEAGEAAKTSAVETETSVVSTPLPYEASIPPPYEGSAPTPRKKSAKRILLPVGILAVAIAVAAGIWALQGGSLPWISQDADTYMSRCTKVDYDDLCNHTEDFVGEQIQFYGEIFDMEEDSGTVRFVMDTGSYDEDIDLYLSDTLIVEFDEGDIDPAPDEWDRVTVYGTVADKGKFYSEGMAETYRVPVIRARYITIDQSL